MTLKIKTIALALLVFLSSCYPFFSAGANSLRNVAVYKEVEFSAGSTDVGMIRDMFDGDIKTSAKISGDSVIFVDLGRYFAIRGVNIRFLNQTLALCSVEASSNNASWNTVVRDIKPVKELISAPFTPIRARYVKINLSGTTFDISEIEVLGTDMRISAPSVLSGEYNADNLAMGKPVKTDSFTTIAFSPDKANDGLDGTYWEAVESPASLTVDFENRVAFDKVVIKERGNKIAKYLVEYSFDGVTWRYYTAGEKIGIKLVLQGTPVSALKARLTILEAEKGFGIYELEFYQSEPDDKLVLVNYDLLGENSAKVMQSSLAAYLDCSFAILNSEKMIINPDDLKETPVKQDGEIFIPISLSSRFFGGLPLFNIAGDNVSLMGRSFQVFDIDGRKLLSLDELGRGFNRWVYSDERGLIVISQNSEPVDFSLNTDLLSELLMVLLNQTDLVPSLAEEFKDFFPVGAALNVRLFESEKDFLKSQFNCIVMENAMKWEELQPEEGKFNFEQVDKIIDWANENDILVRGHTLQWHAAVPDWVFLDSNGNPASKELVLKRLKDHITAVLNHYRGRVYCWDVVNEVLSDDAVPVLRQDSKWYKALGDEFIYKAYEYAREVDPEILLYFTDYNIESPGKRDKALKVLKEIQRRGIHIDGVGIQMHRGLDWPTAIDIEAAIKDIAELGLQVQITELDCTVLGSGEMKANLDALNKLADVYKYVFETCMKYKDVVTGITTWGVADNHSWLNSNGKMDAPLMFDRDYNPKKVFWKLISIDKSKY